MSVDLATRPLMALLVEDNPADAELIALRLEPGRDLTSQAPIRLVNADSMAAACATLRHTAVDVIILDLSLPDASRLEALHHLRVAAPGVPIIVLTGLANEALALEALRAGAQDYVLKPPPDGPGFSRILRYARERHRLLGELDAAVRSSSIAARRWRLLAEAGKTLAAFTDPATALREIAQLLVPDAADCVVLYLLGDEDLPTLVEVAHVDVGRAGELRDRMVSLMADPADAYRLLDALDVADAVHSGAAGDAFQPVFSSLGVTSSTMLPVRFGGRIRGLLLLAVTAGRSDATTDVEFGQSLADRIGLALEQTRLIRQAQLAADARDRAVGIVSHDLGNPLTTIEICAAALLDASPAPLSGVRSMGQLIQRSAASMRRIVQDLLDRASLDAGRLALDRRPTTVADVVSEARSMFATPAAEHDLDFVVDHAANLPAVDADPYRLVQVLSNLLSNAIKFTAPGGRVVLSARLDDVIRREPYVTGDRASAVRFAVSDTGPGILAEDLDHVFDWFWHSRREGRGGTGLGLAIAKGLIEAHCRHLHVESEPGHGSTFWFTMPAAASEAACNS